MAVTDVALISGGRGFLGSHLAEALRAAGWDVHTTSRSPGESPIPGVTQHVCDFADLDSGQALLAEIQPTVVYHLAGEVTAQPDVEYVLPTLESLLVSSVNLLTITTSMPDTRLVLSGSLNEGMTDVPSSPYSAAKTAVRLYARMFHHLYGSRTVFVRPFMTFGPGQKATKVLPYVIRSLAAGEVPKVGSGGWQADWVYVSDVIEGFVKAANHPGIEGEEIDLGRGELVSLRDMVLKIAEVLESPIEPEFGAVADRPDEPVRVADVASSERLIGWRPEVGLDAGLRATIESIVSD